MTLTYHYSELVSPEARERAREWYRDKHPMQEPSPSTGFEVIRSHYYFTASGEHVPEPENFTIGDA